MAESFATLKTRAGTKTRRPFARFSGLESSVHTRYSADFIITTSGFRFSVHTGIRRDYCRDLEASVPQRRGTSSPCSRARNRVETGRKKGMSQVRLLSRGL
jgi:hypothetical protein